MDDKTLVQRLLIKRDAHVTWTVKADDYINPDGPEAATRIEALEAALRDIKNAVRIGPATDIVAWQRLANACQTIATKALDSQP